jgi:hypothetical protein
MLRKIKSYITRIIVHNKLFFLLGMKYFFLRVFFLRKKINITKKITFQSIGDKKHHTICGYYDVNPFSSCSNYLLYHQVKIGQKKAKLYIYDIKKKYNNYVAISTAFCWQLGSRLQWFNSSKKQIFFNCRIRNSLKSKVVNQDGKLIKMYKQPLYSLSEDKKLALTTNFHLLEKFRPGYGYIEQNYNNDNYVRVLSLKNEKVILEYKLQQILKYLEEKNHKYYFNHLTWNKKSNYFLFYLVCTNPRISKVFFSNLKGKIFFSNLIEKISHHLWIEEYVIIFFGSVRGIYNYYIYNFKTNKLKELKKNIFSQKDGHPNSINGKKIVIDTYANNLSERFLYIINMKNQNIEKIGSFYSNYKLRESEKCDLHPKFSPNSKRISIDSSHNKSKQVLILKL